MFNTRLYEYGDLHYLNDISLKATGDPLPIEFWDQVSEHGGGVLIATHFDEPVGFLVWAPEGRFRRLVKICLKPQFEGYGADALLVRAFKFEAMKDGVPVV